MPTTTQHIRNIKNLLRLRHADLNAARAKAQHIEDQISKLEAELETAKEVYSRAEIARLCGARRQY